MRADLLAIAAREAGADTSVTWADPSWLVEHLSDDRYQAFPMWDEVDDPWTHWFIPPRRSRRGFGTGAVEATVRDTLAWIGPRERRRTECGPSPEHEVELLAAWRESSAPS